MRGWVAISISLCGALTLTGCSPPIPTLSTSVATEAARVKFGLPHDAEIRTLMTRASEMPQVCSQVTLGQVIESLGKDQQGKLLFDKGLRDEIYLLGQAGLVSVEAPSGFLGTSSVVVEATASGQPYLDSAGSLCLGRFQVTTIRSAKIEEISINGYDVDQFKIVAQTRNVPLSGLNGQLGRLAIFRRSVELDAVFHRVGGHWQVAEITGYVRP